MQINAIPFVKYQGTGNDFVIINGLHQPIPPLNVSQICHRRFGVGADGLMILKPHKTADFYMEYYNSDGNISTMCGNGGRCIAHFAKSLGIANSLTFEAADGLHKAVVEKDWVELSMQNVHTILQLNPNMYQINTGSPHVVKFLDTQVLEADLIKIAKQIRFSEPYKQYGINVNIVNLLNHNLVIRTYERGVEDETYSCGTGVTAAAIVYWYSVSATNNQSIEVQTKGGILHVKATILDQQFTNIWLCGPAKSVFASNLDSSFFLN